MNSKPSNPNTASFAKRVLCVDLDCFSAIGGGQTAYTNLARQYPEYRFYYPSRSQCSYSGFPNAVPVPYKHIEDVADFGKGAREHSRWHIYDFADYVCARNMAHAFHNMEFDVVDIPDYNSYGRFIPFAFEREGIKVGRYIQSLHGRVSETYLHEWFKIGAMPNAYDKARRRAEDIALSSLDGRYGLSGRYIQQLQAIAPLRFVAIDPLLCVSIPDLETLPCLSPDLKARPVFIGRLERQKGVDHFVHMLWDLKSKASVRGLIVGSETLLGGVSAQEKLFEYLRTRQIEADYRDRMTPEALSKEIFTQASVLVLPSRQDTFNLVALEAVLHGCPVLIGKGAGASTWLQQRFPGAAVRIFSESAWEKGADDLHALMLHFHELRDRSLDALRRNPPIPDHSGLIEAYEAEPSFSREARNQCRREFDAIDRYVSLHFSGKKGLAATTANPAPNSAATTLGALRNLDEPEALRSFVSGVLHATDAPETSPEALEQKRVKIRALIKSSPYLLRSYLLQELSEIEDQLGNPLVAAAYRARLLRWMHEDRFDSMDAICRVLEKENLKEEAKVIALCGRCNSASGNARIAEYLQNRVHDLRSLAIDDRWDLEFKRKSREGYRVSIVVSNYATPADRFSRFLKLLNRSDMLQRHEAEMIVVDSGSPGRQWDLNAADVLSSNADITFIRTPNRESIQQAWNRGLRIACGEYITFLGTDESIRPDTLDRLSRCLDANSQIDWAMGDALVTAVRSDGAPVMDKQAYLRSGMNPASLLFDCTYLGYVGGLYRRTLHERYGYYDASFRGAGDTEFKCRIFPDLRFQHVPETLGQFIDYPSERTTNSVHVELEDARAWYIFHTPGGIQYLFQNAAQSRLEDAFWGALANRRSFSSRAESDVSLAYAILCTIAERFPGSSTLALMPAIQELLRTLDAIGFQSDWSYEGEKAFLRRLRTSEAYFSWFHTIRPDLTFPQDLTGDARFFAHAWLWE